MKLLVSGTREGFSQEKLEEVLGQYLSKSQASGEALVIIEGCATGVDTQAYQWATRRSVHVIHYPAPWGHLGKTAGAWRNRAMLRFFKPDQVVCFHPDISNGRGTRDQALAARNAGIPLHTVGSNLL